MRRTLTLPRSGCPGETATRRAASPLIDVEALSDASSASPPPPTAGQFAEKRYRRVVDWPKENNADQDPLKGVVTRSTDENAALDGDRNDKPVAPFGDTKSIILTIKIDANNRPFKDEGTVSWFKSMNSFYNLTYNFINNY